VKDGKIRETLVEDMSLWHLSMLIIEKLLFWGKGKVRAMEGREPRGKRQER
jgi:hypothetical protein